MSCVDSLLAGESVICETSISLMGWFVETSFVYLLVPVVVAIILLLSHHITLGNLKTNFHWFFIGWYVFIVITALYSGVIGLNVLIFFIPFEYLFCKYVVTNKRIIKRSSCGREAIYSILLESVTDICPDAMFYEKFFGYSDIVFKVSSGAEYVLKMVPDFSKKKILESLA